MVDFLTASGSTISAEQQDDETWLSEAGVIGPCSRDAAESFFSVWLRDGEQLPPPPPPSPPPPHIVTGSEFLALFTPAEIAALWSADPRLMAGALQVAAQDSCNLDSVECAQLMALAVAKGALAAGRVADVLAGRPVTT